MTDEAAPDGPARGLFATLRLEIRRRHYSPATERAYETWARKFVRFHGNRSPRELGADAVETFLDDLVARGMSRSSHQQALSAIVLLYKAVLHVDPPWIENLQRPCQPPTLPVVLSRQEVTEILGEMQGVPRLDVKRQHDADLARGLGTVALPDGLGRKYPNAPVEWRWQWVFPAARHFRDRRTGIHRRHHVHPTVLQRAFRRALLTTSITKRASCHTLRHSFATHLLEAFRSYSAMPTSPPR